MLWLGAAGIGVVTITSMFYAMCARAAYETGVHELRRRVAHLCYEREMQVLRLSVGDEALAAVREAREGKASTAPAREPDPRDPQVEQPPQAAAAA